MKRLALTLVGLLSLAACAPRVAGGAPSAGPTPFEGYVAMGDSITAGVQSGGLTAETQRASYAVLLGQRAGVPITPPYVNDPGCPVPVTSANRTPNCTRRDPAAPTNVVAIPGAKVRDVLETTDTFVRDADPALYGADIYRYILGPNTTQIDAALARRPKLVTLWIGSNDVLLPTLRGRPDLATPPAQFRADYARLLDRLVPSGARLVVLTVPDVTRVPALIRAGLLRGVGLAAADCDGRDVFFGTPSLAGATRETPLSCASDAALTRAEFDAAQATVDAYNAAIRELAAARGVPVFDVNPFLRTLRRPPLLPSATTPFGPNFSLDGVHPSSLTHRQLAAALARFINAQHGTTLREW